MKRKILQLLFSAGLFASGTAASAGSTYRDYFAQCDVQGSTTIYDYRNKQWLMTDSLDAERATLPASTFKILNGLIALEAGSIADEHEVIGWDGTDHQLFGKSYPIWNRDTDLKTAFKNSTIWFYVALAERVGRAKYREVLEDIGYGNGDLSEAGTDFWNYGAFAVSPRDQVTLLVRLYEGDLPFSQGTLDIMKGVMVSESQGMTVFRDKTGWAQKDGRDIGWWVGYVTTADNVYFFATRIEKEISTANPAFSACRKTITKRILADIMGTE